MFARRNREATADLRIRASPVQASLAGGTEQIFLGKLYNEVIKRHIGREPPNSVTIRRKVPGGAVVVYRSTCKPSTTWQIPGNAVIVCDEDFRVTEEDLKRSCCPPLANLFAITT